MSFLGFCEYCGREVQTGHNAARRAEAWEPIRGQGGANHFLCREVVPNRCAHITCAKRAEEARQRGAIPGQGVLSA